MKLHILIAILFCYSLLGFSQIGANDANALLSIPQATDIAEINAINTPQIGSIVFNLDDEQIYRYTGVTNGWQRGIGEMSVYSGSFQITSADDGNTIDITGIPFEPSNITFVAHANVETFGLDNDNQTINNDRGIRNSFGTMHGFARNISGTTTQNVIYVGANGNSINDISRYSSNTRAIGIRYGDQNGNLLGRILGIVSNFNNDGFSIDITYEDGSQTNTTYTTNTSAHVLPADIDDESLIVLYTAYK